MISNALSTMQHKLLPSPYYGIENTYDGKFAKSCDLLREFSVLKRRWPKVSPAAPTEEKKLGNWLKQQRHLCTNGKLLPVRREMLERVDKNILDFKLIFNSRKKPSAMWERVFEWAASQTTVKHVRSHCFPSTNQPYVPTSSSLLEHMVMKTGVYRYFELGHSVN